MMKDKLMMRKLQETWNGLKYQNEDLNLTLIQTVFLHCSCRGNARPN